MTDARLQQLKAILLALLPDDHTNVGNITLLEQFQLAAHDAGLKAIGEDTFKATRDALVTAGQAIKGKGRGGSTARAAGTKRPDFDLQGEPSTPDLPHKTPKVGSATSVKAAKPTADSHDAPPGDPQVLNYHHKDRRKNNPEVGLVNEARDPEQPKTVYAYDPHLDPTLQFDSARAGAEKLIDDALVGNDPDAMRYALEELRRLSAPYLQWTGKAERTSFEVDTVSLHVHERIDAMTILSAVSKPKPEEVQPSLFEPPFESLPDRSAVDFYKHDQGWANRLVAGDSLLVMNSLLQKEGMAGQVQMIYFDPPYGIKYGSNFQPFTNKRDVKDRSDADLTAEPEMIKAFRDTWELGIHSYLTYLRDRLWLAKDLLSEAGSVFVQISDENLHLVRNLMDEIFGIDCFLNLIAVQKTSARSGDDQLAGICDYLVWYCKSKKTCRYTPLYKERELTPDLLKQYGFVELQSGERRRLTDDEFDSPQLLPTNARLFRPVLLTSSHEYSRGKETITYRNESYGAGSRYWSTSPEGIYRLGKEQRLVASGATVNYLRYLDDFSLLPLADLWTDTATGGGADRYYVVQTTSKVIERCMLMTTDPGDLVLDPTCGSGTTAYVAEKWGRRWITCDTSRVAVTLTKQRLITASFDYFALRYPNEGLKGGFVYKTVPHVTLKSIANNPEIDAIYERLYTAIDAALAALNVALKANPPDKPFTVPDGARKGQKLPLGKKGMTLLEWEVPFDYPDHWSADRKNPDALTGPVVDAFKAFHTARQKMQAEMDASIAAQADIETLYDQPEKSKNKLRITGPFTVEAVPFPTVLSLEEHVTHNSQTLEADFADMSVSRSGNTSRQHAWRDELLKAGVRGIKRPNEPLQMLKFAELEVLPGTTCLHASGHLDSGERVVISFGPEHGALEQRQVEHALREAGELFPLPKMIVFCAFAFDPEAAKYIDVVKGITALKAQMNADMLTEDLKKAKTVKTTNQSF